MNPDAKKKPGKHGEKQHASLLYSMGSSILSLLRKKSESERKPALRHNILQISSVLIRTPAGKGLPPGTCFRAADPSTLVIESGQKMLEITVVVSPYYSSLRKG